MKLRYKNLSKEVFAESKQHAIEKIEALFKSIGIEHIEITFEDEGRPVFDQNQNKSLYYFTVKVSFSASIKLADRAEEEFLLSGWDE